ncbi:MAG: SpoIIE family protein phosphatase [Phycisphaeraceae bacterium]|nr:SpoIIE family protein phosphatase [Phycisphaeraceae bacterium]
MRRAPSIRLLGALVVALPIIIASALLVTLSSITSHRIAEDLAQALVDGDSERTAAEIKTYLQHAMRASDLYARRLADGTLTASQLTTWEPTMLQDLLTSPGVASICFGNPAGDATWLLKGPGRLEVGRVVGGENDEAVESAMDEQGNVLEPPLKVHHYDPRERPWWDAAIKADGPVWTPVYFWFGVKGGAASTGTGYTRPIRAADGSLRGVLVIDVTLSSLSDFLKRLAIAEHGSVFVVDDTDLVVAASTGRVVTDDGERVSLAGTTSPAAVAVAGAGADRVGGASDDQGPMRRIEVGGRPARATVQSISPFPGVNWRIVTVLPESVFLSDVNAMQRRSILLAMVVVAASLALGWRLSRSISGPLETLSEHVRRVGAGEFDRRIDLRAARELQTLSDDLNAMAGQLRERIEMEKSLAVAVAVQQSLLPAQSPASDRLDIEGRSKYCDEAGGDYFDFIDVSASPGHGTLIAVGDVMGHGIGAALLMASARAALRARAGSPGGLAELMSIVNRVLASDARHNQFMTMSLLVLDPTDGTARWASAGHDPTLVYRPDRAEFDELSGGGPPLGIVGDEQYDEYSATGLRPGDVLFVGTDGIWEMRNGSGEFYGKERLKDLLRRHHDQPVANVADLLEQDLREFRGGVTPQDDVTFVIARLK